MNQIKIKQYYKILSVVTLLSSIAFLIFPNGQEISERIGPAIGINIAFHLMFQFLSRVPIGIFEQIEKSNPTHRKLAHKMMTWFSIAILVISVLGTFGFLNTVIFEQEYERLFALTIFAGVFLGGYASKLKLNEKHNGIP